MLFVVTVFSIDVVEIQRTKMTYRVLRTSSLSTQWGLTALADSCAKVIPHEKLHILCKKERCIQVLFKKRSTKTITIKKNVIFMLEMYLLNERTESVADFALLFAEKHCE